MRPRPYMIQTCLTHILAASFGQWASERRRTSDLGCYRRTGPCHRARCLRRASLGNPEASCSQSMHLFLRRRDILSLFGLTGSQFPRSQHSGSGSSMRQEFHKSVCDNPALSASDPARTSFLASCDRIWLFMSVRDRSVPPDSEPSPMSFCNCDASGIAPSDKSAGMFRLRDMAVDIGGS